MSKCDKLLEKARNSPNNFSFSDICYLAECHGFRFERQQGSHKIYKHPELLLSQNRIMNFQNMRGKAKPHEVRRLLRAIAFLTDEE